MVSRFLAPSFRHFFHRQLHQSAPSQHGLYPFYNKHKKVTDPARQDQDYFEKEADKLKIDDAYIDQLKLLWEEKIGSERELLFKAQDSLIGNTTDFGLPKLDMSSPKLQYRGLDVLETAPEAVKKLYSLEHGERSDLTVAWKKEMMDMVRRDKLDQRSLPTRIAWATATIRHFTALYEDLMNRREQRKSWQKMRKRPKWLSYKTYLLINARRKMLRKLREVDYEAFERTLRDLRIVYHIEKEPEHVKTRKAWSEACLRRRIEQTKERELSALHAKLVEGRDERMAQIGAETAKMDDEEQSLHVKLRELDVFEGKAVDGVVVGKYVSTNAVGEMAETSTNYELFYKDKEGALMKRSVV